MASYGPWYFNQQTQKQAEFAAYIAQACARERIPWADRNYRRGRLYAWMVYKRFGRDPFLAGFAENAGYQQMGFYERAGFDAMAETILAYKDRYRVERRIVADEWRAMGTHATLRKALQQIRSHKAEVADKVYAPCNYRIIDTLSERPIWEN